MSSFYRSLDLNGKKKYYAGLSLKDDMYLLRMKLSL